MSVAIPGIIVELPAMTHEMAGISESRADVDLVVVENLYPYDYVV